MPKCFAACLLVVLAIGLISCTPSTSISPQKDGNATAMPPPEQLLEDFLNEASLAVVLRFPETITQLGIADWIGVRNDQLMPLARTYELETMALLESLIEILGRYNLSTEDSSQALSARVYGWYLEDLLETHHYSDHGYSISTHISSYPQTIERLLTRIHPLRTLEDAEDHVARLAQISERFDELIVRLLDSERIGAVPPDFILRASADALRQMANLSANETSYYIHFADHLPAIPSLPESTRRALLDEASEIIRSSVLPAYLKLSIAVNAQADRAGEAIGVWRHEGGADYYTYRLRKYTTTNLEAGAIHTLGLEEVARIQREIQDVVPPLGFDPQVKLEALFEQLSQATGVVTGQQTVVACQALIDGIVEIVRPAFADWPTTDILVVEGGTSAYFSPGSLDGSRPGMFTAPTARQEPLFALPTLTYHEAIPGHGLQTAFAYAADLPAYRAGLGFTAYAEGWALYSERLAWEMGAYRDDAYGNLGRLQAELFRAARLVVDTGIHAMQWTYDQAVSYLQEATGLDEAYVKQEIERYTVNPGQATAYKIGMLKILELRERAQKELGEVFDLTFFHQAILEESDVPLVILEELVDAYIDSMR